MAPAAGNPIFDELEQRALDAARHAAEDIGGWFHRGQHASQPPAAQPVTVDTATTRGETMSLLDGAKTAIADVEAKLEGVDETALGIMKAVQASPGAMKVVSALLGVVHVPEGEFDVVLSGLGMLARYWPAQDAAQPPQAA